MLVLFELLEEYYVLAGHQVCGRQKIILVRLLSVTLLVESSFKLLEIFTERVLAAQLVPASKVVNFGLRDEPMLLEHPVDLLFFAPHHIPVIGLDFSPLAPLQGFVDTVAEGCLELDGGSCVRSEGTEE